METTSCSIDGKRLEIQVEKGCPIFLTDLCLREGERPVTNPCLPHAQVTDNPSMEIWDALCAWVFNAQVDHFVGSVGPKKSLVRCVRWVHVIQQLVNNLFSFSAPPIQPSVHPSSLPGGLWVSASHGADWNWVVARPRTRGRQPAPDFIASRCTHTHTTKLGWETLTGGQELQRFEIAGRARHGLCSKNNSWTRRHNGHIDRVLQIRARWLPPALIFRVTEAAKSGAVVFLVGYWNLRW